MTPVRPRRGSESAVMPDSKEEAKAAKKLAKAQTKALKKVRAEPQDAGPQRRDLAGPTPAERSAKAAEEQLIIRRRQIWIATAAVLVALAALIVGLLTD